MLNIDTTEARIGDCGHERNFTIDGALQVNCYDCHDHSSGWSKAQLETQLRNIWVVVDRVACGDTGVNLVSQVGLLVPEYLKRPPPKSRETARSVVIDMPRIGGD